MTFRAVTLTNTPQFASALIVDPAFGIVSPETVNGVVPSFQIIGGSVPSSTFACIRFVNTVSGPSYFFAKSRGAAPGDYTIVQTGDSLGGLYWHGSDGNTFERAAHIITIARTPLADGSIPGELQFGTTASGGANPTTRMVITSAGSVAVGTSDPGVQVGFAVSRNITGSTVSYGARVTGTVQSDVTNTVIGFDSAFGTAVAAFTLTNIAHFRCAPAAFGAGSTVTNQIGFEVSASMNAAGANYGFRGNLAADGLLDWNLYMLGTAPNYMAGSLGIGTTTLTAYALRVGKTITGAATAVGAAITGAVQSDVTTAAWYFRTDISTQAAAFNVTDLVHFGALQGTIGAGSSITSQYGHYVSSGMTAATNNFGFWSGLAAATGVWAFYGAGTARSHFGGQVGIGTVSTGGASGSFRVSLNLTGAASANDILTTPTIQSDVTTTANVVAATPATAAAAFTLTNLNHFIATQGTIGAGSAITNQYGFRVSNTLTGATNNRGFASEIASGANRWNIDIQGTADNRFAGLMDLSVSTAGQIKFPASQNASADANTLDDYEEGTWTPVLTFATPGDLSVAYTTQTGTYTKIGRQVTIHLSILTSTFTHTTASGSLQITGLPFAPSAANRHIGAATWQGITKANYTDMNFEAASTSLLNLVACGSGQAAATITTADMPTGGTVLFRTTLTYYV